MNIREYIWNYPDHFNRVLRFLAPFSYLLVLIPIFTIILYVISSNIISNISLQSTNYISEGTVGYVSSLNPLLNPITQADRDIKRLIYLKLIDTNEKGDLSPSIINSWTVSDDYKSYKVKLRNDIYWHDGTHLTSQDIKVTVDMALEIYQNGYTDSVGSLLVGVKFVVNDSYEGTFVLERRDPLFFQNLSIYIIPSHLFKDLSPQSVVEYTDTRKIVGNGPYKIEQSDTSSYYLKANNQFYLGTPKIENYEYHIFPDVRELEIAYRNGFVNTISNMQIENIPFVNEYKNTVITNLDVKNRQRIIFMNTRLEKLNTIEMRNALTYLLDRDMVMSVANIVGSVDYVFISETSWAYDKDVDFLSYNYDKGVKILEGLGYTLEDKYFVSKDGKILSFSLSYIENDKNNLIVKGIVSAYEKSGILVELKPYSFEQMNKEVLATRSYELIMYDIEKTIDPDQYDLWHSSRIDYPNLNLSGYRNDRVDLFLERGRSESDRKLRQDAYSLLQRVFALENPALGLFRESFSVVYPKGLNSDISEGIYYPEDRYKSIHNWKF